MNLSKDLFEMGVENMKALAPTPRVPAVNPSAVPEIAQPEEKVKITPTEQSEAYTPARFYNNDE